MILKSEGDCHPNLQAKANNQQFLARATEEALPSGVGRDEHGEFREAQLGGFGPQAALC